MHASEVAFRSLLSATNVCITYSPLSDEIDPFSCPAISEREFSTIARIPTSPVDPISYANEMKRTFSGFSVCVLIPGIKFDIQGNRKGRGGGWFDRFLSATPRVWLRIGVLDESRLCPTPLTTNPWDAPMDWLLIQRKTSDSWQYRKTAPRSLNSE